MYGALFLAIGILWLSAIFVRCEGFLPRKKQHAFSYQKIQRQLMEYLEPLSLRKHVPKMLVTQFWILAHWEFACAFFYLLSGLLVKSVSLREAFCCLYIDGGYCLKNPHRDLAAVPSIALEVCFSGNECNGNVSYSRRRPGIKRVLLFNGYQADTAGSFLLQLFLRALFACFHLCFYVS